VTGDQAHSFLLGMQVIVFLLLVIVAVLIWLFAIAYRRDLRKSEPIDPPSWVNEG
jgi:Na+-transporting methylmalonyl-CoA/oxaloacetate decarboxylase gamma subunit